MVSNSAALAGYVVWIQWIIIIAITEMGQESKGQLSASFPLVPKVKLVVVERGKEVPSHRRIRIK